MHEISSSFQQNCFYYFIFIFNGFSLILHIIESVTQTYTYTYTHYIHSQQIENDDIFESRISNI